MALKDRIDVLNGLTNSATNCTNLLNLEAPAHIRYIPDDVVRQVSSNLTDAGSGVSLGTNGRLVYAHKAGRRAQLRDAAEKAALTDANSLHFATALTPAAYVENASVFIVPGGGTAVAVVATTLNSSSDDVIGFLPSALGDAVQVKVAWRLLASAIFGSTSPYEKPAAPTITYIPAGFSAMATAAIAGLSRYADWSTTTLGDNDTALDADDIEIANARLERGQQQLQSLQMDLQALVEKYRADAQNETNADLQNQAQEAAVALQNYGLSLQRYQNQIAAGMQMLQALYAQYEAIMSLYIPTAAKAVQKTPNAQPAEASA